MLKPINFKYANKNLLKPEGGKMKTKLLKRLRNIGRNQIEIVSVTTENTAFRGTIVTGMAIAYSDDIYSDLFSFGNTVEEILNKAARRYIKAHFNEIRSRYRKYSCRCKQVMNAPTLF